jgi:phosphoribosylanthranilate isomerase
MSFSSTVRVKICGITSPLDAKAAVEAGADALGFNFYEKSPRYVDLRQAAGIIAKLPPFVSTVAVFVNPTLEKVQRVLMNCRIDSLQFHGDESPAFLAQFPADKVIKALPVKDKASLKGLKAFRQSAALLLDAYHPKLKGGTGKAFNWDLAKQAKRFGRPVILAGGLNPQNVAEAVVQARPFAVDTASGVEISPGKKDAQKMRAFVANAKKTDNLQGH